MKTWHVATRTSDDPDDAGAQWLKRFDAHDEAEARSAYGSWVDASYGSYHVQLFMMDDTDSDYAAVKTVISEHNVNTEHPRPSLDKIVTDLRNTCLQQALTTPQGQFVNGTLDGAGKLALVELFECIVRNQASIVDTMIDIAIKGE